MAFSICSEVIEGVVFNASKPSRTVKRPSLLPILPPTDESSRNSSKVGLLNSFEILNRCEFCKVEIESL